MRYVLITAFIAAVVAFGAFHSNQSAVAADCGPRLHWVDDCAAGVDVLPNTGALVGVDFDFDCMKDTNLILSGPTTVSRGGPIDWSSNFPTESVADGHIDTIDTEIISMQLTGGVTTLRVGTGTPGISPLVPQTLGYIAETGNDSKKAYSGFDVFFEVEITSVGKLYNHDSLRVTATIEKVPPLAGYYHPTGLCLPLYTSPILGQGTHLANLVEAQHCTIPGGDCPTGGTVELPVVDSDSVGSTEAAGAASVPMIPIVGVVAVVLAVAALFGVRRVFS